MAAAVVAAAMTAAEAAPDMISQSVCFTISGVRQPNSSGWLEFFFFKLLLFKDFFLFLFKFIAMHGACHKRTL
jgi:hypothetical protein